MRFYNRDSEIAILLENVQQAAFLWKICEDWLDFDSKW